MSIFLVFSTLFAFVFGAVIGSFLNVVIYRLPRGESVVMPPSHCPKCDTQIRWYDNIPIVSWIVLDAQCRHCGEPISGRYAAVEGLVGILSALLWLKLVSDPLKFADHWVMMDWTALMVPFFCYFGFVALCVAIAFIDLDHLIIPHELSIPGIFGGIGTAFAIHALFSPREILELWPPITPYMSITGAVAGAVSVLTIFILYFLARGVAGMGGGDVTLMAMMGAWLGWPAIIFIFFASSVQGLIAVGAARFLGLSNFLYDSETLFAEDEEAPPAEDASATDPIDDDEAVAESSDAGEDEEDEEDDVAPEPEADEAPTPDLAATEEAAATEISVDGEEGPLAIPFGPFIVLAGLEHFYLGTLLPDSLSMIYMYML